MKNTPEKNMKLPIITKARGHQLSKLVSVDLFGVGVFMLNNTIRSSKLQNNVIHHSFHTQAQLQICSLGHYGTDTTYICSQFWGMSHQRISSFSVLSLYLL